MTHPPKRQLTLSDRSLPNVSMETRIKTAASAGFTSIGVSTKTYRHAIGGGLTSRDILGLLDEHGLVVTEVEFLKGWWAQDGDPREEYWALRAVEDFNPQHVNIGLVDQSLRSGRLAERLRELLQRFHAECLAIESMPFGAIPRVGDAVQLIREVQLDGLGLVLDTWHLLKAGTTIEQLAHVPPDLIACVQMADVDANWSVATRQSSLSERIVPGRGEGRLSSYLRPLMALPTGVDFTVEVMSHQLDSLDSETRAALLFDAAQRTLAQADEAADDS